MLKGTLRFYNSRRRSQSKLDIAFARHLFVGNGHNWQNALKLIITFRNRQAMKLNTKMNDDSKTASNFCSLRCFKSSFTFFLIGWSDRKTDLFYFNDTNK